MADSTHSLSADSSLFTQNGPLPIHDVVVMAVRKAVSAATITFTAISTKLCFFIAPLPSA